MDFFLKTFFLFFILIESLTPGYCLDIEESDDAKVVVLKETNSSGKVQPLLRISFFKNKSEEVVTECEKLSNSNEKMKESVSKKIVVHVLQEHLEIRKYDFLIKQVYKEIQLHLIYQIAWLQQIFYYFRKYDCETTLSNLCMEYVKIFKFMKNHCISKMDLYDGILKKNKNALKKVAINLCCDCDAFLESRLPS